MDSKNAKWLNLPSSNKAVLRLPSGREGGGLLTVYVGDSRATMPLGPAKVDILLTLRDAQLQDENYDPPARGWRSYAWLAENLRYPVEKESLRRSISRINRQSREALDIAAFSLVVVKRGIGMRLDFELEIDPLL